MTKQSAGSSNCMLKVAQISGTYATGHKKPVGGIRLLYYPPEVSSMKYCCLGVFRKEYVRLATNGCKY